MAQERNNKNTNRCTVVTDALAKPQNEKELAETISSLVNATRGSNGDGQWDGGVGGEGTWVKYRMFWDAKLVFSGLGSTTITFPFTVVDSVVRVIKCGTAPIEGLYYVNGRKTLDITGLNGTTIIELSMVKNTKETI